MLARRLPGFALALLALAAGCGGSTDDLGEASSGGSAGSAGSGTSGSGGASAQGGGVGSGGKAGASGSGGKADPFGMGGSSPAAGSGGTGGSGGAAGSGGSGGSASPGGAGGAAGAAQGGSSGKGGQAGQAGQAGSYVPQSCADAADDIGCCGPDDTVYYCGQNGLTSQKCAPGSCGWDSSKGYYDCDTTGHADPSGSYPQVCAPAPTGMGGAGGVTGAGGAPTGPSSAAVDLRADTNRDGKVDLDDPADDEGEDSWDKAHGAVFLANIDDDQETCPKTGSDLQLPSCNDAADEVVNGPDDELDLAPLRTRPWPDAPAGARGQLWVSAPSFVRVFKKQGDTFVPVDPSSPTAFSEAEIKAGLSLALEGRDVVRDASVWDGTVDLVYAVSAGGSVLGTDKVTLRVAPMLTRHHLDPAEEVYASHVSDTGGSAAFRADLAAAVKAAGVPAGLVELDAKDQWTQDFFETAYMAMPASGGQHVIHVYLRSANVKAPNDPYNPLRAAGKLVFTFFRGKDRAGVQQYTLDHPNGSDTTNSFGNLETIPPYTLGEKSYPFGRVIRGNVPSFGPDKTFLKMIEDQKAQSPFYIDTSWLLVGHVDETLSFIKAPSPRGWALLVADPQGGRKLLEDAQKAGHGSTAMFAGMKSSDGQSAETTIDAALADADIAKKSQEAAAAIDGQLAIIKAETGLGDDEIVRIPFLFESVQGYGIAYQPGMVNGIYLADGHFGSPDPHGPVIDGKDIVKQAVETQLSARGVAVHWVEDWDLYHALDGEVHCGSNTRRATPASLKWWEAGL